MNEHMLIFGLGYTASHLARALRTLGWRVTGVRRNADGDILGIDDDMSVRAALNSATYILSTAPPEKDGVEPILSNYGGDIANAPARWVGYLSSTGVYGDVGGAWVDEGAQIKGRRPERNAADQAWQKLRGDVRIFRLPGIYGVGRSALDRVRAGNASRIDLPDQIFSRIHVEDIVSAIIASFDGPAGVFNLADDFPCAQNAVIEHACRILGMAPPPLLPLDHAGLSPMARSFYAENRRVSNNKAKRLLGWVPYYSQYKHGLNAIYAAEMAKAD